MAFRRSHGVVTNPLALIKIFSFSRLALSLSLALPLSLSRSASLCLSLALSLSRSASLSLSISLSLSRSSSSSSSASSSHSLSSFFPSSVRSCSFSSPHFLFFSGCCCFVRPCFTVSSLLRLSCSVLYQISSSSSSSFPFFFPNFRFC